MPNSQVRGHAFSQPMLTEARENLMVGKLVGRNKKRARRPVFIRYLAEMEGAIGPHQQNQPALVSHRVLFFGWFCFGDCGARQWHKAPLCG
jgi:hypothetical protein